MLDGTLPSPNITCEVDEPNPFVALGKEATATQS